MTGSELGDGNEEAEAREAIMGLLSRNPAENQRQAQREHKCVT